MGGLGSGRPRSGRNKVDAFRSIDVNHLHREGCLKPGSRSVMHWMRGGEQIASIGLRAEADRLHLSYRVSIGGGEWEEVKEIVPIVRVPCRYGGTRPYFVCPGIVNGTACGRRAAKLYGPGRNFLCRHCYRLAYACQSEDLLNRSVRQANKIRRHLGGNGGMAAPFPPRPKGMWRRTYERLREQVFDAEERADNALLPHFARLLAQTDRSNNRKGTRSFWK